MPSYLVTGASRGLGYAWITHLASNPTNTVFGLVRNKTATEEALAKDGIKNVHVLSADVTDHKALLAAAEKTAEVTGGGLDILIHNAAYISERSQFFTVLDDKPEEFAADLTASFQANVVGATYLLNAFLPLIRRGKDKKIAVLSSGMADLDLVNQYSIAVASPYTVSKAAANMLVSKYHAALGKQEGILVLSISPGFVNTRPNMLEEEIAGYQKLGAQFAEIAPDFKGPIASLDSVKMQLEVIDRATVAEFGGAFVSHHGDKNWL
ncbi:Putative short-chain dehydrogenase/reductase SDR, NAD(P)-binding domain superfamily [Septoria linicola]|uniref:Short-chain dehydrogenase/reductase SDR, NAD(P)-binding domain superfamily n=1 Tax=Septoria linicola TaxID=215465 RepID=A0A9Q9AM38_9PEZI|nr:putative short-chain dehydrogenase/reductase SDR, NAD(P)-binding domain superfamily [Septoria linicola]USW51967.1 Putative short-chain dehydrogenase/reductase SDR, NAD(P)-binding domain superfamily [Septoria linicola]